MKKILFLNHTLGGGGAEKVLVNLVNELVEREYDITLMTIIDTGVFKNDLSPKVHYKTMFKLPFLNKITGKSGSLQGNYSKGKAVLKKVYEWLWRNADCETLYTYFIKDAYDYEIAFLEGICTKIIAGSTNIKSKKIGWIHIDLINEKKSEKFYANLDSERKCYSKFNKIVCVSDFVRQQAIKKLGIEEEKLITVYNSINADEIILKSNERKILHESQGLNFCTIGRLVNQKGYDRLINVTKKLVDDGFKLNINIIGEGPEYKVLQKKIIENNLDGIINLLGFKSNPYPYIQNSDVFISTSRAEGFSTVASEAVILGKSCIVTDCSGMRELFGTEGEYGYIVENNEEGIYKGMKAFLINKELVKIYGEKSMQNRKRFNINEAINSFRRNVLNEK